MGMKDRMAEKMLGGATSKAMKGLIPLMNSIHTYLELQAAFQEKMLKIIMINDRTSNRTEEMIDNEIKCIKSEVVDGIEKPSDDPTSLP